MSEHRRNRDRAAGELQRESPASMEGPSTDGGQPIRTQSFTECQGEQTVNETHPLPEVNRADSGTVTITSEDDILDARQTTRGVVDALGFRITDVTRTVTAVSELARNVYLYAGEGTMTWWEIQRGEKTGIELRFEDEGPGIQNLTAAVSGNYSTSQGMGRGLEGTRELMDTFKVQTSDDGTTVTVRKWNR